MAEIIGFSGFSGSGKTTLIEKLIPILKDKGLKVAVIKHDVHGFEMDREGKDTYRFSAAGADMVHISSHEKSAGIYNEALPLEKLISMSEKAGIVLIEGYKHADIPRIGITSVRNEQKLPGSPSEYLAVITDDVEKFKGKTDAPIFDINDTNSISEFILDYINSEDLTRWTLNINDLTHFDSDGNARMVNVGDKEITERVAVASGKVMLNSNTFDLIKDKNVKKGDVLTVATVAGIMGAKRTPDLIPMCHPIILDGVDVKLRLNENDTSIDIEATVKCTGRTGVEMEAITACSVAALTVYDMCKAVQRDIVIKDIHLVSKTGGVHGDYRYED
ncbi:MAG: cyclic pyranopterin monophosphate synthase MoaC [Eubacterium sp.]|nr:cyclic pyranopterin monophosphate synthase MoaC [Eubacterium sp.]